MLNEEIDAKSERIEKDQLLMVLKTEESLQSKRKKTLEEVQL